MIAAQPPGSVKTGPDRLKAYSWVVAVVGSPAVQIAEEELDHGVVVDDVRHGAGNQRRETRRVLRRDKTS